MVVCKRCEGEFRDGVQCTSCMNYFDFPCAGITEAGYRKLGDRKTTWKCVACKNPGANPLHPPTNKMSSGNSPTPIDMESVMLELKQLTAQTSSLPKLMESVKDIKDELAALRTIKPELSEVKGSVDFMQQSMDAMSCKISDIDKEIHTLLKTKEDVSQLQQRVAKLETLFGEEEQRSRMNNIEIKGIPVSQSENLFQIVSKIGDHINCTIPKEQINYVARVPMRSDKQNKTIIIAVHSRYLKDDFVAAAKKYSIFPTDLGLRGDNRIFVNDHLTIENKMLLNKAKALARERGFAFIWVKGCKIFIRKNPTSPVLVIKTQSDLKKIA